MFLCSGRMVAKHEPSPGIQASVRRKEYSVQLDDTLRLLSSESGTSIVQRSAARKCSFLVLLPQCVCDFRKLRACAKGLAIEP